MNLGFFESVYNVVKQIPKGKVATYGQIAKIIGRPHASKFVGFALNKNPYPYVVPCHRVVNKQGCLAKSFAFGGEEEQKLLLVNEGVEVNESFCIDLNKYLWQQKTPIN